MKPSSALLIIDIQNDFCPGGALAVADGDTVIPVINSLSRVFPLVVATRDWHPADHVSFASSHPGAKPGDTVRVTYGDQALWPDHCVAGTPGAEFHPALDLTHVNLILHKGTRSALDSYSAFFENDRHTPTGLDGYLRRLGTESVHIAGLATDYCVFFTARDARSLGFEVFVIVDASRGIDLPAGNVERALGAMRADGVHIVRAGSIG